MMAFCNIHCLRKSSRIIVIPTTSVNVLWDAIVPLSPAHFHIFSIRLIFVYMLLFFPYIYFFLFILYLLQSIEIKLNCTSVVFLNINNKRHISVHPKEDISFGKGVSIFMSFFCLHAFIFSTHLFLSIYLVPVTKY
jgi:hypothetical protein